MKSRKAELVQKFPSLQSDRLLLRKVLPEDGDPLYRMLNDPKVSRHISFRPETLSFPERLNRYFEDCNYTLSSLHFAIVLQEDRTFTFAGLCSYQHWNEKRGSASMGYMVLPEYWNRGIATEAARLLLSFGFDDLELKAVYASCVSDNAPSQRVLIKCGFEPADKDRDGIGFPKREKRLGSSYVMTAEKRKKSEEGYTLLHK